MYPRGGKWSDWPGNGSAEWNCRWTEEADGFHISLLWRRGGASRREVMDMVARQCNSDDGKILEVEEAGAMVDNSKEWLVC
jgi:hypothetical protein